MIPWRNGFKIKTEPIHQKITSETSKKTLDQFDFVFYFLTEFIFPVKYFGKMITKKGILKNAYKIAIFYFPNKITGLNELSKKTKSH